MARALRVRQEVFHSKKRTGVGRVMSEQTPERALARVIDRQAHEIDRLRARVAELEMVITGVQAQHTPERDAYGVHCRICSPQDGTWRCITRLELDAVLPPEEQE